MQNTDGQMIVKGKKKIKQKKTNRTCNVCKVKFTPQYNSVQPCCSIECAVKSTEQQREKAWKKEKKIRREGLKTHSHWSKELQIEVNTIVRLIDKGAPCISSLRNGVEQIQAGHRFSVGAFPALRFHLDNIHAQTAAENNYNSGNPDGFDHGLSCIYGDEYMEAVHELKLKYPVLKLTIPELVRAKARAKKIVKELKMLGLVYPARVRIELRREYNKRLGIYV